VNLATAFLAATVVGLFENTIGQVVALAALMPIVAGMGGNAATQTLAVIVRGLALNELTWTNSRKALTKEALVGLTNGVALGTVAALGAWLLKGNPLLGLVLALAMIVNMFVAATAGTLIPLGLRALKVDPALASSVFITTLTDVFGFLSFLGLATVFLKYLV
jgi:magnesium transporter